MSREQPPPGWYPDPSDAARSRWWNGQRWTNSTRPRGGAASAGSAERPAPAERTADDEREASHRPGGAAGPGQGEALTANGPASTRPAPADGSDARSADRDPASPRSTGQAPAALSDTAERRLSVEALRATSLHELRATHEGRRIEPPSSVPPDASVAAASGPGAADDPSATIWGYGATASTRERSAADDRSEHLRLQRAARRDLVHHRIEPMRASQEDRPSALRRAAVLVGQTLLVLGAVIAWTALLGWLLMEEPAQAPAASAADTSDSASGDDEVLQAVEDGSVLDDAGAVVLGLQLDEEAADDEPADDEAADDEAADESSDDASRSFGALPPLQVEFDDQCTVEVDPELVDDVGSVWPWQFEECEFAPVDLDDVGGAWIVVVSSIGNPGTPPASLPSQRNGQELDLLWSSHYPSLNPGWWVLYAGPFDAHTDAVAATRAIGGSAYVRYLEVDDAIR